MEKQVGWTLVRKRAGWIAGISFGLAAFIAAGVHFDWGKSDWAAWVQAVGSIAAILAAARIATWQAAAASREFEKRRAQADRAKAQGIKYILRRVEFVVDNAARVISDPIHKQTAAFGNVPGSSFEGAVNQVEMAQSALRGLPVFEIPSPELIFLIQRADRDLLYVLRMLRSSRLLYDPTRRSRTGPDSLFVRIRNRLAEATAACDAIADRIE